MSRCPCSTVTARSCPPPNPVFNEHFPRGVRLRGQPEPLGDRHDVAPRGRLVLRPARYGREGEEGLPESLWLQIVEIFGHEGAFRRPFGPKRHDKRRRGSHARAARESRESRPGLTVASRKRKLPRFTGPGTRERR